MQEVRQLKKSIHWVNYTRAISMIAVYYIHAQELFNYSVSGLGRYILPFYVNAFYFVSGYLLFRKVMSSSSDEKETAYTCLKNILFRLVIPSILFSIIFYYPSSILQNRSISFITFIEKTICGGTFWFTSSLAVAELIFCIMLLCKIKRMYLYYLAGIALFATGMIMGEKGFLVFDRFFDNPWCFEKGFMSFIFLVIGGTYWKYELLIDRYLKKPAIICLLSITYFTVISLFNSQIRVLISMNDINIFGAAISVLSIFILVMLCKLINKSNPITKFLDKIGTRTMGLYLVCGSIPKVVASVLPKGALPYMVIGFAVSVISAYLAVIVLEHFFPFVFDLRKIHISREKTN